MNSLDNSEQEQFTNQESADVLFHYTNNLDSLISIMNDYFIPFFSMESINELKISQLSAHMAFPMVCFCDIPLERHATHKSKFGEYGIGMKKEWGIKKHLTPVVYYDTQSYTACAVRGLIRIESQFDPKLKDDVRGNYFKYVSLLMMMYKPYKGEYFSKKESKFSTNHRTFYDEREWRYFPTNDGPKLWLEMDEYKDEDILKKMNNGIQENNRIDFELNDIEYLFLKNEDEIEPFLSQLKSKYSEEQIVEIRKKIQPFKKLD